MSATSSLRGDRLAVPTAVTGTVLIAAGAFWLSFTALADLARRSGIAVEQAWAWPLIVDGIIVVATVAVVALSGTRRAWYPWMLLLFGAGLSVTANSIHAVIAADTDVPPLLAASVAAVPPLVLLAITHLTVILTHRTPEQGSEEAGAREALFAHRSASALVPLGQPVDEPRTASASDAEREGAPASGAASASPSSSDAEPLPSLVGPPLEPKTRVDGAEGRAVAGVLRAAGWSNKKIARHLGLAPSTVGRWYPRTAVERPEPSAHTKRANEPIEEEKTP